ncbi:alpha/beta fold hydrolase, partial [Polaromonas sp.]|uniref:YheT family hydrolase n=1 Tax=Polaromonas sp. TaxID=1869339 RepID=UPI003266074D
MNYAAPWWLPGGNLQTIWAALRSQRYLGPQPLFRRERWDTPDSDFVDVDWMLEASEPVDATRKAAPLLVVFHGLEGSSASHYAEALADVARERGWGCAIPHFRGCSGELNLAPRAYHSGDFAEIDWILRRFALAHAGPVVAVGISLGGNALMRWAGELGAEARKVVAGIASVCSPLDLAASGWAIGRGFNRQVYTR